MPFIFDKVPLLNNQPYAHGAFMGSAPEFVDNPIWMNITSLLMPDVFNTLRNNTNEVSLIKQMENNPIIAAFGVYETYKLSRNLTKPIKSPKTLEIDMFLPSKLMNSFNRQTDPKTRRSIAKSLVKDLLVAHGTGLQLAAENLGFSQYESIIGNEQTNLGGVTLLDYFSLFSKAISLIKLYERSASPSRQDINNILTKDLKSSVLEARRMFKLYTGSPLSIMIDIKSANITSDMINYMLPEFNNLGILASHIASFKFDQITDVNTRQVIGGVRYNPPVPVKLFHMAGDLQQACLNNELSDDDTVSFNIGSMISYKRYARGRAKKASYKILESTVAQLKGFKDHYNLHIFGYIQEFDIDEKAISLLIDLVNKRPDIFDLGFAWGNVNNRKIAAGINPSLTDATTGLATQILVGSFWDDSLPFYSGTQIRNVDYDHDVRSDDDIDLPEIRVSSNKLEMSIQMNSTCNSTYTITLIEPGRLNDSELYTATLTPNNEVFTLVWTNIENGKYFLRITKDSDDCDLDGTVLYSV